MTVAKGFALCFLAGAIYALGHMLWMRQLKSRDMVCYMYLTGGRTLPGFKDMVLALLVIIVSSLVLAY